MIRRAAITAALMTIATILLGPGTAGADPAGPTDYRSEIVAVTPDPGTFELWIEGGDSFVVIDVVPGTEVVVPGYRGEPYLWIDRDGTVWENRRSPARFENRERYGVDALPPEADHTAPPDWRRRGSGGTWAWHDHRAHRMERFPPINVERGEQVLDGTIPLVVDGTEVTVRVVSHWMQPPSPWPAVIGGIAGAAAVIALRRRAEVAIAAVAAVALVVGGVQFASLHPATEPSWSWWGAPALALAASCAAAVRRSRATQAPLWTTGATLVGAAQLMVWGLERRLGLVRAILPTDVPFWVDRAVTAGALAAGSLAVVVVVVALVADLFRTRPTAPAPAPR